MTGEQLIVGLGSPHGDDQAGWRVIERLHERGISADQARVAGSPTELWDCCRSDFELTVCDARAETGCPGRMQSWTWPDHALPVIRSGTHDLQLGEVLTLGTQLGCIPPRVRILTISGSRFAPGDEPSDQVLLAARSLADQLWEGLAHA